MQVNHWPPGRDTPTLAPQPCPVSRTSPTCQSAPSPFSPLTSHLSPLTSYLSPVSPPHRSRPCDNHLARPVEPQHTGVEDDVVVEWVVPVAPIVLAQIARWDLGGLVVVVGGLVGGEAQGLDG